jgi:hypothetical protein
VVEYEEVAMVKSCHGVGLRVLRYWEQYLVSLVKQKWSKWVSNRTR